MIHLKTDADIRGLLKAAALVEGTLAEVASLIEPGVRTNLLDEVAEEKIKTAGARPAFKGYQSGAGTAPFPSSLCISVGDVVVHGMPGSYQLRSGDIVTVDCGVELDGYYGDFAYTFAVGEISEEDQALLDHTKASLYEAIDRAQAGNRIGDIGHAVQSYCEARGYGVVRDLVGHGIGREMHEEPQVPNVGRRGYGKRLREGMTLCIEPMINRGTADVVVDEDGWTIRTADGLTSAHFEHMVLVKRGSAEILSSFDAIEAALEQKKRSLNLSPLTSSLDEE